MNKKLVAYWLGIFAEYYAIVFLFFKGYRLLARRYKTLFGEVDLIFLTKDYVIAVEVKWRGNFSIDVSSAVCNRQFHRIASAMKFFLNKNGEYYNRTVRFDTILIRKNLVIRHLKNVWIINE